MKKYMLPMLIALSALAVSATAAFYSVTGLSKLFAGASFAVIIMASSLEVAKLVIASFLYQYWSEVNKMLKAYLVVALGVLILITSAGIYGFLTSAYQQTTSQNLVVEQQVKALETKKISYTKTRDDYIKDKEKIAKSTSELRTALSTGSVTQYKDPQTGQIINIANAANRKAFEKQLENIAKEEEKLSNKIDVLNDSVFSLDAKILDIQSKAETSGELGPLKYLANLTGYPMDKIINWFVLVIILVFDPLAISLVIAANFAFNQLKDPNKLAIYNEKPIEVKQKVTEHKVNDSSIPNPPPIVPSNPPPPKQVEPKKSIYQYIPPVFRKKRDEDNETKTY